MVFGKFRGKATPEYSDKFYAKFTIKSETDTASGRMYFRCLDGSDGITFPVNPVYCDPQDSRNLTNFECINSPNIWYSAGFDSRIRILQWDSFTLENTLVSSVVSYLRNHEGEKQYILFNNIGNLFDRWDYEASTSISGETYKLARIISFEANYKSGGQLRYDSFSVKLQPERV